MKFPVDTFLSHIDTINEQNYCFGNELLYKYCGFDCLPSPGTSPIDTKLSSAIWLIGKSYSADPTRSARSGDISNEGLGSSFDRIAKNMYNSGDYAGFYADLLALCGKTYCYCYEDDKEILLKTVDLVHRLNEMVRSAMGANSNNVVSFCSKFLHFMCPDLFFITDAYSYTGGMALYTGTADRKLYSSDDDPQSYLCIDKSARSYFKKQYPLSSPEAVYPDAIRFYYGHCLRAYSVARFLHENSKKCVPQIKTDPDSCYMPRLVDSVLMRIKNQIA